MKIKTIHKKRAFLKIKDFKNKQKFLFKVKITKKLHEDFIKLSGDNSPIHSSVKFCKKNNYKKLVGHAFLLTSILSKIYGIYVPGGSELCLQQSCNFKNPFYINDELNFEIQVKYLNKFSKILILSNKIKNQDNKIIFFWRKHFIFKYYK